ncbi:hypothetical protein BJY16_006828 [Actinoplanes octamycinicus]|uniref:Uncharacterized protein n=1 Tax=Actinoplanes octamycinicus TaxID=135948 RepID=A0A7W7H3X5_9ACTN|nr:hypothetical protein [Actinoplanes octamycinicus]MBB4743369.1 hypothetical protein [Actinoplanes octamycinicus]GIE61884.1 hypothetical protein Aoc01nite_72860 [Actinoplanes octamycinicus]
MTLDAFVYCRCWQDGLAVPPPVGPVGFDEDGRIGLLAPWSRETADAHDAVDEWVRHGCAHEGMELADEHLGAWSGVRSFEQALREAGSFGTLLGVMPRSNGGQIPVAAVPRVVAELDHFERAARLTDQTVLVDEGSGRPLYSYIESYGGVFILGPDQEVGVDPHGFFVVDKTASSPTVRFRAMRFSQRVLPGGYLELAADGQLLRLEMSPIGSFLPEPPQHFAVESRPRTAADYSFIVGALRRLCAASLTTGNPVMWT